MFTDSGQGSGLTPEIAALLKNETIHRDPREIPFDPLFLPILEEKYNCPELATAAQSDSAPALLDREIDRLLSAIERKLSGRDRDIMLLHALTGWSNARIAAALNVSKDTARRHLEAATAKLTEYATQSRQRYFPRLHRSRRAVRVALFPLDTDAERKDFQDFANQHALLHVAYSATDHFREVLIAYIIPSTSRA